MKIKQAINKGVDKCKEAGTKVKEYMVDDTAKDLKKILEVKKKEDPHSHLEKFDGIGIDCSAYNEGDCEEINKKLSIGFCIGCKCYDGKKEELKDEGTGRLLYCAKCNAWHKGDINWDNHE